LLPLKGRLVLAVFAQVAKLNGFSDLLGQRDVELALQALDFRG